MRVSSGFCFPARTSCLFTDIRRSPQVISLSSVCLAHLLRTAFTLETNSHHAEWLGDIIVRPAVQAFYLIEFRFSCRYQDHRDIPGIRIGFQSGKDRISVLSGSIISRRISSGFSFARALNRLFPSSSPFASNPVAPSVINQKFTDILFILNTKYHSIALPTVLFAFSQKLRISSPSSPVLSMDRMIR